MIRAFKNLKNYILDSGEDIQDRLFIILTCIALMGMFFAFLAGIVIGENLSSQIAIAVSFIVFSIIVVLGYKFHKIRLTAAIVAVIMVFILFPVVFFTSGGIYGGSPIWFVFGVLYIGMILNGWIRIVFFIIELIMVVICYYVQYNYPHLVLPHSMSEFFFDSIAALLVVSMITTFMMYLQTMFYRAENDLTKSQKEEIDVLNKAQNRFFSNMSHEIRTPINTIIGLNEMILREHVSPEVAEDALSIQSASSMLLHLVNDILDMSKLQSGQVKLSSTPYDPRNTILDIVNMMGIRAREKHLEFSINVEPDIPSRLKGDEVRIKQILINVVNNAIKYTDEGYVSLNVLCSKKDEDRVSITFSVSDSGMGIKKESIPYLFTAYKRMDEEKNKLIEGTGLGLSIVKQLVDLMGGKITVNSVYTKGSTFIIEIPQEVLDPEPIGEMDLSERHSSVNVAAYHQSFEAPDAKVLIVDDTRANLIVASKLLRDTGVSIDTASSGEEALKKTLQTPYNVIFMDHLMPVMDGIECMHRIRTQTGGLSKEARIVALTANAGSENEALYDNEGFDGYLLKPVSGRSLEDELRNLLPPELITMDLAGDISSADVSLVAGKNRRKAPVIISTSSASDIPEELIRKYRIAIIPLSIETEEGTFRDMEDIDPESMLTYMIDEHKSLRMKPLEKDQMEAFFAEQLQYANNIIHISVTSRVDATSYNSALEASGTFDNVTIFDTGQISTGQGMMALEAGRLALEGRSVEEILTALEKLKHEITTSLIVENMQYLAWTNKVNPVIDTITRAFMIRSVLYFKNGRIHLKSFYFGSTDRARMKYISRVLRKPGNIDKSRLFITYVGLSQRELDRIRESVDSKVRFEEVIYQKASPSIASTTGPGTFGLLFRRISDKD